MFRIRGHTLLCLHGFRGEGYSEVFVKNMQYIHQTLYENPDTEIEVISGPDDICLYCPHLENNGCTLDDSQGEREVAEKDMTILNILGLSHGKRYRWRDIQDRVRKRISSRTINNLCSNCRWFHLGYCREFG